MGQVRWTGSDWQWGALVGATFIALLLVNPLGYIGGGWDDWQYLQASRCWVEHGPCLPRTHWEGRWPVFVPIAAIVGLFGESRTTVGLWPLTASIAAIALLILVGNRLVGRPVGWLAGLLLLVTPAFSIQILDPSVEAIELAFILGGVLSILVWLERRRASLALLAGLSFGLAFQVRETSLIAVALAGIFVATRRPRAIDIAAALAGFLSPLAIELIVYGMATGDPLFRRHLSLAHTQIPSSELLGPVDKGSPFFNRAYIANWRHEPGIHLHWLIDGFANLFVNAKAGLSLALVPLLLLVSGKRIAPDERRMVWRLYGVAILYAAILIYVFAVDPKARVMFVPLTATSVCLALVIVRLVESGRTLLPVVAVGAHALVGLTILLIHQRTDIIELPAARWIAQFPGEIEIDPNTRRHLALVPGVKALGELESERGYLLYNSLAPCAQWLATSGLRTSMQVSAQVPISRLALIAPTKTGWLCLFKYHHAVGATDVRHAISGSRADGANLFDRRIYRPEN